MGFTQIIEYKTTQIDELNTALDASLEKTNCRRRRHGSHAERLPAAL
jgi:hypothetical protein